MTERTSASARYAGRRVRPDGGGARAAVAVGLLAGDGVVLAADPQATDDGTVAGSDTDRIAEVHRTAAVAFAGSVGDAQSLRRELAAEADRYEHDRGSPMSVDALATRAGELLRDGARARGDGALLVGGVDADGAHLFVVDADGGALEDEFAAVGDGAQVALGALERGYDRGASLDEARSLARDAVSAAGERDTAAGGTSLVATVTTEGIAYEEED